MEVRQESAYHLEIKSGGYKETCLPTTRVDRSARAADGVFKGTDRSGPDRHYTLTFAAGVIQAHGRRLTDLKYLGLHVMFLDPLGLDGTESSGSDVQSDLRSLDRKSV